MTRTATAIVFMTLAGCDAPRPATVTVDAAHDHGPGPHGGVVFDFGPYHAEYVPDPTAGTATINVLSLDLTRPTPIAAEPLQFTATEPAFAVAFEPSPQPGDPAGRASRFVATHDQFRVKQPFRATVTGRVGVKTAKGALDSP